MPTPGPDRSVVLARALEKLEMGSVPDTRALLRSEYPFEPVTPARREYSELESLAVFARDGFIDRYDGRRLVNPAALRILSAIAPGEFPYHPNWKMSETHIAYWELCPTLDHLVPIARGGADEPGNWVTTSMFHNSAKANALLAELGWSLVRAGDLREWDGLSAAVLRLVASHPAFLSDKQLARWHRATEHLFSTVHHGTPSPGLE